MSLTYTLSVSSLPGDEASLKAQQLYGAIQRRAQEAAAVGLRSPGCWSKFTPADSSRMAADSLGRSFAAGKGVAALRRRRGELSLPPPLSTFGQGA